jgi:murein DD-endopeptidase MepM/ murein hydrolase activator NlpD
VTGTLSNRSTSDDTITRQAVPHTTFPDRPRAKVITHTVEQDETLWTIAAQYDLAPETIAWSNREVIQDAPWLIQPGLQLFILPVDGIYHTVRDGETVRDIAEEYGVDPSALYNQWNDIEEGQPLQEGQLVVVPGGQGDEITWEPPQPAPSQPRYSYQYSASSAAAPAPNNWFILPTGSTLVSGWYFHDPRNPTHIGLDYKCHMGDPLYAADNGVVTIAGWNGGYGILVEVSHGNGFTTRYGHFSQLVVGAGQVVHQGDLLGYCGSTGWSTGPHLHFEIRKNGVPQDPMAYQP